MLMAFDQSNQAEWILREEREVYTGSFCQVSLDWNTVSSPKEARQKNRPYTMRVWILKFLATVMAIENLSSAHVIRSAERNITSLTSPTNHHIVHGLQKTAKTPLSNAKQWQKRNHLSWQLGSGWDLRFQTTFSFLPIHLAAVGLCTFYEEVMSFAVHAADAAEDEVTDLTIEIGNLVLEFVATERLSPVSWELVHDVARTMLDRTNRGCIEGYQAVLKNGISLVVVRLGLKAWELGEAASAAR